ncbi:homoserine O-acetyltransferase [Penicillium digitatum]|uniref:AB hydrolase-1 domain-containing protein n=3 Tax=Penicillium digitatum TaxID=36651 RepID=K9F4I7_PEND2|nr:hypothetical protein PDIP_07860 [Penicillium digitatum Pd1]EKV04230.1 hypothetical protein PDIG_90940 [Penicillium digitatum PHI26]EKV21288.1 hypothetical protein PDIP_07860 [Penicillium digitatum Pd1]QQK48055.1 homoserine O-acetyltransferase [Penicillium digitatum]
MVSGLATDRNMETAHTKRCEPPTQRITRVPQLDLEFGGSMKNIPVAYTTHGTLSPSGDNVIVICHALSGSAEVGVWWRSLLEYGPGAALDPSKYFIVCMNCLGSPYGTASPLTDQNGDPSLGSYGPDFPLTSIRDDVRLFRLALKSLGVTQILSVIGGSMGGMHVMEFAYFGPEYVKSIIPIATSASYSAWGIGWGEMQRQCIYSDTRFRNGRYNQDESPAMGLAAARMAAMLSYRSQKSFQARFGRKLHEGKKESVTTQKNGLSLLSVQSYLQYQGDKFVDRFDANCYIALTHKLDTHDVSRGRSSTIQESLALIKQPALVLSIRSDVLFTFEEQLELHRGIPNSFHQEIISDDGHDGFLLETEQINGFIRDFLQRLQVRNQIQSVSPVSDGLELLRTMWQSTIGGASWLGSILNVGGAYDE